MLARLLVGLALAIGLAGPLVAAGENDLATMVETAKTPADHEAIAKVYQARADDAAAKAAEHRRMGAEYKELPFAEKGRFHEHCEALVRSYESAAKELAALAEAHRQMAKRD